MGECVKPPPQLSSDDNCCATGVAAQSWSKTARSLPPSTSFLSVLRWGDDCVLDMGQVYETAPAQMRTRTEPGQYIGNSSRGPPQSRGVIGLKKQMGGPSGRPSS